jgi:hypothetical protein
MSAANEQIYQLKRMGFSNEEVAEDLRYDKEVVDLVSPEVASASQAIDKLEDLGDSAVRVLIELMNYAENERVRNDAAKFLAGLQYDKEKTKHSINFSDFTERMQRAQEVVNNGQAATLSC